MVGRSSRSASVCRSDESVSLRRECVAQNEAELLKEVLTVIAVCGEAKGRGERVSAG